VIYLHLQLIEQRLGSFRGLKKVSNTSDLPFFTVYLKCPFFGDLESLQGGPLPSDIYKKSHLIEDSHFGYQYVLSHVSFFRYLLSRRRESEGAEVLIKRRRHPATT
jgi:hypothetical protein